jgi:hypothetical protein
MKKISLLSVIVLIVMSMILTGCFASTTTASCAYIVGDGTYDSKVHKIVYPGQQVPASLSDERIYYVPCNSRNFIINDGTVTNANGDKVGDRSVLIKATTSTGVPITISARALWTLNQDETSMKAFYSVCLKYNCASTQDQSGDSNFATAGWNGMLAENFGPAMDSAARDAAIVTNDDVWQKHDPAQYKILGDSMSAVFAEKVRQNLGYPQDLFCGSGNSAWENPASPGVGTFTCSPVRIIVDDVQRVQVQADESTEGALSLNAQRLSNAEALYGIWAGYWLGLQDTIEACKNAGVTCVFNIGGPNDYSPVGLPTNNPAPVTSP